MFKNRYFYLVLMSVVCACTSKVADNTIEYISLTDDLGRTIKIKKEAKRFLPLAPSVTEILYLICDTSEIVGRTPNCNYPKEVFLKPVVNNYPPDLEKILYLKPDLVITKDGMLSLPQATAIEKMGIPVYFQKYDRVEDIFERIEDLGKITHHQERGKKIADSLRKEMIKYTSVSEDAKTKKVLMLISKESYFVFGKDTYASDLVKLVGGSNAVDSVYHNPYPMLTAEYILKVNPDIMIGGASVGLSDDFFELHKELKRTSAYKNKQYYMVNDDYLSRPGPRVVEAMKALNRIIQDNYSEKESK
jgi:iron complex transport system substrate-binding protein